MEKETCPCQRRFSMVKQESIRPAAYPQQSQKEKMEANAVGPEKRDARERDYYDKEDIRNKRNKYIQRILSKKCCQNYITVTAYIRFQFKNFSKNTEED